MSVSDEAKNRAIRLFSYIDKVLSLDDAIERDFRRSTTSCFWLADMPISDNIDFKRPQLSLIDSEPETNESTNNYLFRVDKKDIKPAPKVPQLLEEWIEINYREVVKPPKNKETISLKASFDDDPKRINEFKEHSEKLVGTSPLPNVLDGWVKLGENGLLEKISERYIEYKFNDDKERVKLFQDYIEHDWNEWQEYALPIHRANQVYDEFYALRLRLKNEGDSQELLWGHGLLNWKHPEGSNIYSPIYLTPLIIEFDPAKRVIELVPDPMSNSFCEINAICELGHPSEVEIIQWADTFSKEPFDLWNIEALKTQGKYLTGLLSENPQDVFNDDLISNPQSMEGPAFWNAPIIYTRKRSTDLWSKYAQKIRLDIETGDTPPTPFITDLVGEEEKTCKTMSRANEQQDIALPESELFFPLPWNEEQKRIAEQLEKNYGAVVKGPPGTGKSHTIANLISRCLAQGKTVLVTSQTSKALAVLRDKLPREIRSLVVSQIEQSARHDEALQSSIAEISANLNERNTRFSDQRVKELRNRLKTIREEKAILINAIKHWSFIDSQNSLVINNYAISPIEAAKELVEKELENSWLRDKIDYKLEQSVSEEEINEYVLLLKDVPLSHRDLIKYSLPDKSLLPNQIIVENAFSSFRKLKEKAKLWEDICTKDQSLPSDFNQAVVNDLIELIEQAKKCFLSFKHQWEQDVFHKCVTNESEYGQWISACQKMTDLIKQTRSLTKELLGHSVEISIELHPEEAQAGISKIKCKCSAEGKLRILSKIILPKNCKFIIDNCKIDGLAPLTLAKLELLEKAYLKRKTLNELKVIWDQVFCGIEGHPECSCEDKSIINIEAVLDSLNRILAYKITFAHIDEAIAKIKPLSHLSFCKIDDLNKLLELLDSSLTKYELASVTQLFVEWGNAISSTPSPRHSIIQGMLDAINNKDTGKWETLLEEHKQLQILKEKAAMLATLNTKISGVIPLIVTDIHAKLNNREEYSLPGKLDDAWRIARIRSWLDELHNKESIDILQNKLERFTRQENDLNAELIAVLAWQRQIDRVNKRQRDALMAWSLEMKKYGKGTGKYAHVHLQAAQRALKDAKDAVPVWIMPLHRVAQMFPDPKSGMFDLVIFDEASQCDIKGIAIGYLGKQILVVGDPEQISPAGIFQNQEKVFDLILRYLFDIPHKESFSTTSSLFDIAALRLPNIIMLIEHFRSVPDIIAFSNHWCYENKIKPLRYPNPKGMLIPALNPIFVDKGYQNTNNKANEPEAEALVNKLIECLEDLRYAKRLDGEPYTFGVISLLSDDQAKYIDQLLSSKLNEKVREERKLICGDAYAFQGDERDVMFLSMVKAIDQNNPDKKIVAQVREITKQTFNVAASRARDQVFLFHSLPVQVLSGNQEDWRYRLLNWYYNPRIEEIKVGKETLMNEFKIGRASQFSLDVGNLIINRGYKVIPEYEVIGRRIDLVVQGDNARLAVECDGDKWHGLEQWENDQKRERQLRRAGWEFWRITGSSFYRYKERALESLWKKLDEMGIQPV